MYLISQSKLTIGFTAYLGDYWDLSKGKVVWSSTTVDNIMLKLILRSLTKKWQKSFSKNPSYVTYYVVQLNMKLKSPVQKKKRKKKKKLDNMYPRGITSMQLKWDEIEYLEIDNIFTLQKS